MKYVRPFLVAVQFLTLFPVPLRRAPRDAEIGGSALYYPAVGLLIAAGLVAAATAMGAAHVPGLLEAALVLALWVLLTGGLHLDGLADSVDAWIGGRGERERTLAIMKDPTCGPMAVSALIVVLLVRFAALDALLASGHALPILLAPVLGRTALPALFLTTPYVRPGGLGSAISAHLNRTAAIGVVAATCGIVLAAFGAAGLAATISAAAVFLALRRMMIKRLGGTTGDTAGALVELVETVVMTAAAVIYG
ncbi:MAG TPA: adenosylcobinamide-GDP ribazoletransferase [Desulfuromonadales bacterium]|nr:adenosylcobinamide-GDP ribazoletransferase [Desulfuromonadales bacterium]